MQGNTKRLRLGALMIAVALLMGGCSGAYVGVPRATVLDYQSRPTYGHLYNLAYAYAQNIDLATQADTMHPGMYADYGVALALMGHPGEACRMFNAEARAFPQSAPLMQRLKQQLVPDLQADTTVGTMRIDVAKLELWAYDSLQALRPLPPIAAVIDSTDTAFIRQQTPVDSVSLPIRLTANQKREMLEEQQRLEAQRQQEIADSIAAEKQAKIDARKQAQADKVAAKQAQQKARKQNQKQKQREAREKQRVRKQQQKQRDAERKQQKKNKKTGQK